MLLQYTIMQKLIVSAIKRENIILFMLAVREYASFGRSENNGLRHQP